MKECDPLKVQLEIHFEQGMEGIEWAVYDNTKQGYEGLIVLNEGDYLEISGVWKGYIRYDLTSSRNYIDNLLLTHTYRDILDLFQWDTKAYSDEKCKQLISQKLKRQVVEGYTCNWLQKDVEPSSWLHWFRQELPAYYCKVNVN